MVQSWDPLPIHICKWNVHGIDDDVEIYNYVDDKSLFAACYNFTETTEKLLFNVENLMSWFDSNQI
jgi:hypothetical protein